MLFTTLAFYHCLQIKVWIYIDSPLLLFSTFRFLFMGISGEAKVRDNICDNMNESLETKCEEVR